MRTGIAFIRNLYFGLITVGTIGPMLYFGYRRFEIAEMNGTQPALAALQGGLVTAGMGAAVFLCLILLLRTLRNSRRID